MHRLRGMVVIGVLALAVSVVGAGPAFAAKGGNNDTAHACQQGGHEHRFDAATDRPFKNAGDCVSNGAKGRGSEYFYLDPTPYGCLPPLPSSATCCGTLEGRGAQGLEHNTPWQVFYPSGTNTPFTSGTTDAGGNIGVNLNLPCGQGSSATAIEQNDNVSDTSPTGC